MKKQENSVLVHRGFCVDGDNIWFVSYGFNVLCKYDMVKEYIVEMLSIPEIECQTGAYYNVTRTGDYIVMTPGFERKISIYSINEKKMNTLLIPDEMCVGEKFQYVFCWKNQLFLFPMSYSGILNISMDTLEIEKIRSFDSIYNMFVSAEKIGSSVYLVNESNVLFEFDLIGKVLFKRAVLVKEIQLRTVNSYKDGVLVLTDLLGNLYTYDLTNNTIEKIWDGDGAGYDSCVCVKGEVMLIPTNEPDYIPILDVETKKTRKVILQQTFCKTNWSFETFSKPELRGETVYLFSATYGTMLEYNFNTGDFRERILTYEEMKMEEIKKMIDNSIKLGAMREGVGPHATLDNFLKVLLMEE